MPARAQDARVTWMAGAVVTAPLSGTADYFNPGFGASAGAMWNLGEQLGVRADAAWSTLTAKGHPSPLAGRAFDVSGRVQVLNVDVQFQGPAERVRPYILGGVGVYRRAVTVESGAGPVCVPWWFVCEAGSASVAGSRSVVMPGINLGIGVVVGRFFGEVRYHYSFGPTYATAEGDTPASGKFLPLTVGMRF